MSETITIQTQDGAMDAYLASPAGAIVGGMVVLQEAFGVNAHITDVCDRLAREGYLALAPELFHRQGRGLTFGYEDFEKVRPMMGGLSNDGLTIDVRAGLAALRARPQLAGRKAGVIGFCLGGFAAFLAACRAEVAAAVCFYAGGLVRERPGIGFKPVLGEAEKISAPVLMFFGGQDQGIPPVDVDAVRSKLEGLRKAHEIVLYPEAGHGFFCDKRASYHPPSAADAWKRVSAWLGRHVAVQK